MSAIDRILQANEQLTADFPGGRPTRPKLKLAIVTCMDSRLDLFGALGLEIGDAHLLRNAGGLPTEDVLRSLAISQRLLGTQEIAIIHHTKCGMEGFDDNAFRYTLIGETSAFPSWRVDGFTDAYAQAASSVETVRQCPFLPHRDVVRGFVYDVDTGKLREATQRGG